MASILDQFKKNITGSNSKIFEYTDTIGPNGDFQKVYGLDAIFLNWDRILQINKETYDHDPLFGGDLLKFIFRPTDAITMDEIKTSVYNSLTKYDSRATITNIEVTFFSNMRGFKIEIFASYDGDSGVLTTTITE